MIRRLQQRVFRKLPPPDPFLKPCVCRASPRRIPHNKRGRLSKTFKASMNRRLKKLAAKPPPAAA